jgi:K+-transporting ATPase ATPase C chain
MSTTLNPVVPSSSSASAAATNVPARQGLLRPALVLFVLLSVLTGLLYPLLVTGVAQLLFPQQAAGSLLRKNGQIIGSSLIAQSFTAPQYFWSRPSATSGKPYDAANSGGSNLGPTNPALVDAVKGRIEALRAADPGNTAPVPIDLVTASASGLDPEISRAAADWQVARVAQARGLPVARVRTLVAQATQGAWLGFIGEPRVNVLELNLALDALPR